MQELQLNANNFADHALTPTCHAHCYEALFDMTETDMLQAVTTLTKM